MYCIVRPMVPENNVPCTYPCLHVLSILRILDIHDFISDMVLLHTKNKAVSLKVANSVVHVYKDEGMSHEYINVNTPKTLIFGKF